MVKNKKNKSVDDNPEETLLFDLLKFIKWNSTQLAVLGYKIHLCCSALEKYDSYPSKIDTLKGLRENLELLRDVQESRLRHTSKIVKQNKEIVSYLENTKLNREDFMKVQSRFIVDPDSLFHMPDSLNDKPFAQRMYQEILDETKKADKFFTQRVYQEMLDGAKPDNINKQYEISNLRDRFKQTKETLETIDIMERQSLDVLVQVCFLLDIPSAAMAKQIPQKDMIEYLLLAHNLTGTACEALGYWKAKLEEMKRGKKNVEARTKKKESNKAKLKEMMKTMKPQECRLKAQEVFGVTDRTVLNWLKEIKEEKTALLRKNTDTA